VLSPCDAAAMLWMCVPDHVARSADEATNPPAVERIELLSRAVYRHAREGEADWFPVLFAAVEQVLSEGDEETHRLVTRGLLSWLYAATNLNDPMNRGARNQMMHWLGPATQQWWDAREEEGCRVRSVIQTIDWNAGGRES
jgi:hypothetical protein